ncbi:Fibronectin type III domain protein [Fimbriimonas ginsengisoli Gsoil 348]|uniref:Fibronectin type III domain protein n=1 Tax=Fimbriimonas ginsengisoli Gsoil 348 TaxID=661478 RepID=A0A068NPX2_FIMGI|nr:Fibronectin type III domain protein [Fimbriimonas ginsengisoli Gsoil 348]
MTSISVGNFGTYVSGSLSSIQTSDNLYYTVHTTSTSAGDQWADVQGDCSLASNTTSTGLNVSVESNIPANATLLVFFQNVNTLAFDNVKSFSGAGADIVQVVSLTPSQVALYRNASTGVMKYYLRAARPVRLSSLSYDFKLDQLSLTTPIEPPINLQAAAISSSQITLSWGDQSSTETGFRIERKGGASGTTYVFVTNAAPNSTTFTDSALTASTTYTYRVRSFNASENSAWSNEASATTLAAGTVPVITLTAVGTSTSQVSLYWNGVPGAIGYNVYRSTTSGGPYTKLNSSPINPVDPGPGLSNAYLYSNPGLSTGTTYYYVVKSVINSSGTEGVASNESSDAPTADSVPYDTGNAATIVAKIDQIGAAHVTGWAASGRTVALGPNGVTYSNGNSNGASAYGPTAQYDAASNLYHDSDNATYPVTMDGFEGGGDDGGLLLSSNRSNLRRSEAASHYANGMKGGRASAEATYSPLQLGGYNPTAQPSGPFRKVEANAGFSELRAAVYLPSPSSGTANLKGNDTSAGSSTDTAYIYTGVDGLASTTNVHVDVGFQCGSSSNPGWKVYGLNKASGTWTLAPKGYDNIYVNGAPKITWTLPSPGGLPNYHGMFVIGNNGGAGSFSFVNPNLQGPPAPQYRYSIVVRNLKQSGLNTVTIKRVNSIAQRLRFTKANGTVVNANAPLPNGPSSGLFMSGAYQIGGGWGDIFGGEVTVNGSQLESGVNVYKTGAYPGLGSAYVKSVDHNPEFWEEQIQVRTSP